MRPHVGCMPYAMTMSSHVWWLLPLVPDVASARFIHAPLDESGHLLDLLLNDNKALETLPMHSLTPFLNLNGYSLNSLSSFLNLSGYSPPRRPKAAPRLPKTPRIPID